MKETYKKILLKRRAAQHGLEVPKGPTGMAAIKFLLTVTLLRPVHMLAVEVSIPVVSCLKQSLTSI
jgi:hypothetical protein